MKEQQIIELAKDKIGISELNEMQKSVVAKSSVDSDVIIYSPTGTGKTLAFSIPVLKALKSYPKERLQVVIIAPSRELVQQIYQVIRPIAAGVKVSCAYGGHNARDERQTLSVEPSILVATPGRLLDRVRRGHVSLENVRQVVVDEFDKCLELGFEEEMKKLFKQMPNLSRRMLTSATVLQVVPDYIKLTEPIICDFLRDGSKPADRIKVWNVKSEKSDKLDVLLKLLLSLPAGKVIVFANFRDSVERICDYLTRHHVSAGLYHGALEQIDREKAIAMFNNGTFEVLITTDLGSRGLDINMVKHIIHYHFPISEEAFTHRNGRTARVDETGSVYVIVGPEDEVPEYMKFDDEYYIPSKLPLNRIDSKMATIYFTAGRKEKISKGDIVGFIAKNANLMGSEIGYINISDHHSLAAIPANRVKQIIKILSGQKLKGKKVKISQALPNKRLANDAAIIY